MVYTKLPSYESAGGGVCKITEEEANIWIHVSLSPLLHGAMQYLRDPHAQYKCMITVATDRFNNLNDCCLTLHANKSHVNAAIVHFFARFCRCIWAPRQG
jgi:hypothetical protein